MIAPRREIVDTPLAAHGGRLGLAHNPVVIRHDFSVCLNAFGPAAIVRDAVQRAPMDEYPDPYSRAPREAAARAWDIGIGEVSFGAGAAELIQAVCFAYLRSGDEVLILTPAFGEYERAARLCGARSTNVALADSADARATVTPLCVTIEQRRPKLVFLCTPGNPTGRCLTRDGIRVVADCCEANGCLLVLDQAYDAFSQRPLGTPALRGHAAVLYLRSLTKDHALAGVRAAFAVGPATVISALEHARAPWCSSSTAQAAAVATFADDAQRHVRDTIAQLREEALRLSVSCRHAGFDVMPPMTHFFLIRVGNATRISTLLLRRTRIYVRDCTSFGLPEWIRVVARTPPENDVLIKALRTVRPESRRDLHGLRIIANRGGNV